MYSINITTTSGRLSLCSATVWSLINQTFTPDAINIWISHEAYLADRGIQEIPAWVDYFNSLKNIIKIHYVKNTGPYRKIIPALREAHPEDVLIYGDDDVIYDSMWLETLIKAYIKNNGRHVVAARIRTKEKNILGFNKSYHLYGLSTTETNFSKGFIITGVGGCVIAKKHIRPELLELDDYLNLAPKTDDLWISKIIELSGTVVTSVPLAMNYVQEIKHENNALSHINVVANMRNTFLGRMSVKFYNRILGYLGYPLSNNDLCMNKIDSFFDKNN
ncbi:glycosyltransferase family A protein [Erwiniaceae bacterium CAU 1747]